MVEFICARTETETIEYILSKIRSQVKKDPLARIIVLVPPQATLSTENHIMRALGVKGLMGVWVMGPEKLTQRILDTAYGRARQVIDAPGKSMVLRRLMDEYTDDLPSLGACARTPGIYPDLADAISELKSMDISPEQIASLRPENTDTRLKLKDLAFLYEKHEAYLKDRALTGEDRMNIAADHVRECKFIAESDLYVLDFGLYTSQMTRLVAEAARAAQNAAVTFLDTHPGDPDADLFEISRRERAAFQKELPGAKVVFLSRDNAEGEISHVAKNLYAYPYVQKKTASEDIKIIRALHAEEEVAAAAEMIAQLAVEGFGMREIAVACASTAEYADRIKEKFTPSNIPFFLDDKRSALDNFAARFLLSALRMAGGRLSRERLLAHIESAFGPGDADVSILKNYAHRHISNAYQFEKPLADETAEAARVRCVLPALSFRKAAAAAKTAGEKLTLLDTYMREAGLEERIRSDMDEFIRRELFESAEYFEQAYKRIGEVLEQAGAILGDTPLSAFELAEVIKTGLEAVSIRLIPQGADEVVVGDVGVLRLYDIRALIVLGVNEGKIPNYEEETGILSPEEKDYVMEAVLGRRAGTAVERQKLAIYRMFSLPAEKLVLSYHELAEDGQRQPSSLIARMGEILTIKETEAVALKGSLRENAMERAVDELRAAVDGYTVHGRAYLAALLAREDTRETLLKYERFAARPYAARRMERALAGELYGGGAQSVSRFEAYYACPFRHYVLYGLKPEVPGESKIESLDVGNFVHGVLDGVCKNLKGAGRPWSGVSEEELLFLLRESADSVREADMKYTLSPKNKNTLLIVERELYWALRAIRRQFETSSLSMEETEHCFEIEIAGVRMKGVIDRLDTAKIGEQTLFKVVDYKTGDKSWSLQDFYEGLSLQLVIYMLAGLEYFRQRAGRVQAAGADYFTVRLPLLETFDPQGVIEQYKMKGLRSLAPEDAKKVYGYDGTGIVSVSLRLKKDGSYYAADAKDVYSPEEIGRLLGYAQKLVARAAGEIEAGSIDIAPRPDEKDRLPCRFCDFRSVCMLDEADMPGKKEKRARDAILKSIEEDAGPGGV
jgi:ATP-dependent helicase/DNAse subunit B